MATVVQRIKEVKQPRGGYINPKSMSITQFNDGAPSPIPISDENISASIVGMAVDYMTRALNGAPLSEAFKISLLGASIVGESGYAKKLLDNITGVNASSIISACQLVRYDVAYRVGPVLYEHSATEITPNEVTIGHISKMLQRSVEFFSEYGPVTSDGFEFPGAYTETVTNGDGDFLTSDTLWDFKVSVRPPTKDHTLQLLMYYLMGKKSGQKEFDTITHLGIFNPRLNAVYRIHIADVSPEVIKTVSTEVIGYK